MTKARKHPPTAPAVTGLYASLLEAMEAAHPPQAGQRSGFAEPGAAPRQAAMRWRPVGAYPDSLVREPLGEFVDIQIVRDRLIIGVRAGGGMPRWQREAQRDTTQYFTVILDGRHEALLAIHFDGSEGWQFEPLALPTGLAAEDLRACEVEREGRLLFSGHLEGRRGIAAERINLVRYEKPGLLVGWALSRANPDSETFGEVVTPEAQRIFRTAGTWEQERMRRFRARCPATDGALTPVSVKTLAGREAERSPVWVFATEKSGFMVCNPRLSGDDLIVTIIGEPARGALPATLRTLGADAREFSVNEDDAAPFLYLDNMNSVRLPIGLVREGAGFAMYNALYEPLGTAPPLAPLLETVQNGAQSEPRDAPSVP